MPGRQNLLGGREKPIMLNEAAEKPAAAFFNNTTTKNYLNFNLRYGGFYSSKGEHILFPGKPKRENLPKGLWGVESKIEKIMDISPGKLSNGLFGRRIVQIYYSNARSSNAEPEQAAQS
jgi:hypothetical protein